MTPDYGRAFALWRAGAGPAWDAYVRHPFVTGLGDGTLPKASFLHYLAQDYVFLIHFARAWALAVVKAGTLDEMRAASATVEALVNGEMSLHQRICAEAGIADLEATVEAPASLAYTRYVLEAGYSGDLLDLLAALAPCVLGYGEIGARLLKHAGDTPTATGSRPMAARTTRGLPQRRRPDRRRAGPPPRQAPDRLPRWATLQDRFTTATRLEVEFWAMGLRP